MERVLQILREAAERQQRAYDQCVMAGMISSSRMHGHAKSILCGVMGEINVLEAAAPKVDPQPSAEEARRAYIQREAVSILGILIASGGTPEYAVVREAIQYAAALYDAPIPPVDEKEKA
jgi:hypothetical protein